MLTVGCVAVNDGKPAAEELSYKTQIAAGAFHTVGLNKEGYVISAGSNSHGQGSLDTWTEIQAIAAGFYHTLGLKADGTVLIAGSIVSPFGIIDPDQCSIDTWTDIAQIDAGGCQTRSHSVGLRSDGTVVACGDNSSGQGNVNGLTDIIQVAAGGEHTVALRADGTVTAVGKNDFGQLNVNGWTDIIQIAAGVEHTVGLKADGTVIAVGDNEGSQLAVSDWEDIIQVGAGDFHSVGLKSDGTVVAAGSNEWRQTDVASWSDIVQIAVGWNHTVGLKADDTALAAGNGNMGQIKLSGPFNKLLSLSENSEVDVADNLIEIEEAQLRIEANPEKGFQWHYYLFVPSMSISEDKEIYLLVGPNNTSPEGSGLEHDDYSAYQEAFNYSFKNRIANIIEMPLLVPVFPRPYEEWWYYTHVLNRNTLQITSGSLERLDLQLIAMIEDAQLILSKQGLNVQEKVLMTGFSACGIFTNRFTALHPQLVKAAAYGGICSAPIIPAVEWADQKVRYPVGIADIEEITGIKFDYNEYIKVPQYMYMCSDDDNDGTLYDDGYERRDANLIWSLMGKDMNVRWESAQEIYKELGVNAEFKTYTGKGHFVDDETVDDVIYFFKMNMTE